MNAKKWNTRCLAKGQGKKRENVQEVDGSKESPPYPFLHFFRMTHANIHRVFEKMHDCVGGLKNEKEGECLLKNEEDNEGECFRAD